MTKKAFIKKYKDFVFIKNIPCGRSEFIYNIVRLFKIIKRSWGDCGDDIIYHFYKNDSFLINKIKNMKFDYCFSEAELIELLNNKEII
jgi:hypothetical protein